MILNVLQIVFTSLEMAEHLENFETYYKAFETTGCIDGVENCQYHANSQIYTIAGEILSKFCETEKND